MTRFGTPLLSCLRRGWLCAGLLALTVVPLLAAKPPEWTVVKTRHFTVLTSGKAATAQAWATDLERLGLALGLIMPVNPARLQPVIMVIFPNDREFDPYKMLQDGKPAAVAGYFSRVDHVNAIGLALSTGNPAEVRHIIFHEATHWFASARTEVLPPWMNEGVAEVFSTFTADEKSFAVGDAIDNHVKYLSYYGVPDPRELVETSQVKLGFSDRQRTGLFYAGSWLLVHWAMFGEKGPGASSLSRYNKLIKAGQTQEAAFAAAFGGDYETVQQILRGYLADGHYTLASLRLPAEPLGLEAPRKATEAEVEYGLGALLMGARGPKDGLPHLIRATELDGTQPAYWEAVGFAQMYLHNKAEELAAFDRAIATGSKVGQVWALRGWLRQSAEDEAHPSGPNIFTQVADDYRHALELDPFSEATYNLLTGVIYREMVRDPLDEQWMEAGRRLFPNNDYIKVAQIILRRRVDTAGAMKALKELTTRDSDMPEPLRRFCENILEEEQWKVISKDIERLKKAQRYAELITEFDGWLARDDVTVDNRRKVQYARNEADQLQRLHEAEQALNSGQHDQAVIILQKLKGEMPATGIVHDELARLVQRAK